MTYLDKPRRLWWRKALFQVHLWVGIVMGLYIIVIGISGAILVFKQELASLSYPDLMKRTSGPQTTGADLATVMDNARAAYPHRKLVTAYAPSVFSETYFAFMEGPNEQWFYVFADPGSGRVLGALDLKTSWLFWIAELHYRLLAGQGGLILNGIGAGFLVLLCLSGLILWWPGIKIWTRALKIDFRRSWRRINFDLHSAGGFWILGVIFMWALSGVYFAWPKQFEATVNHFSSVSAAVEPMVVVSQPIQGHFPDSRRIFAEAERASPGTTLAGIYIPEDPKSAVEVFMARGELRDFSQMDRVYFDPYTGEQLAIWHSGVNPTMGSKLVYWLGPLHFGVYWGMEIKILWATLGLSLPLLTVTGAWMYWNRSLSRYWRRLRSGNRKEPVAKAAARKLVRTTFSEL